MWAAASNHVPRDQTGQNPGRNGVGVGRGGVVEARLVESDGTDRTVIAQMGEPPDDDFTRLLVGTKLHHPAAPRHPAATRCRRVVAHVVAYIRGATNVRPQV